MKASWNLVRATVVDNQDEEKLGRVKVKYPFLGGQAKEKESFWAKVARPVAQVGAGDWFLPDKGDEVLVGFENSDFDRPIVLASLFHEERKPFKTKREGDFNENGKNNLRAIRTKAGHLLVFDDLEGKESISIIDKASNQIILDSANEKIEVTDAAGNQLTLDGKGKKVSLKDANGNQVDLADSGTTVKGKSGDEFKLDDSGVTIKSANKVSIQGSSKIELGEGASKSLAFGEEIMKIFNQHTHPYTATMSSGVTQPPVAPMTPSIHSKKVKSV